VTCFTRTGATRAGAVLIGEDGQVIERLGRYLGERTNNQAEYRGCILGLERAKQLGASDVEVYADSELLVRQLAGQYKVKNEGLKPLHLEAQSLLRSFRRFKLTHIPREENTLADEMSNRAIDEKM
jgi:ribonuclease HI